MTLGDRIQKLRKTKGWSQEQFAELLGVSRQAVSKWETDQASPEIENILAISKVFAISTDELLGYTSSAGSAASQPKHRQNMWFLRFITLFNSKTILWTFALCCFVAIGICAIVDVAMNGYITWTVFPALSIVFGFLVFAPLIFKRVFLSLCALTVTIAPFLYCMNLITPEPSWGILGLLMAAAGLVYVWLMYLLFRLLKISYWYKAAIAVFLGGSVLSPLINYFADSGVMTEASVLNAVINVFTGVVAAGILGILGYTRKKRKQP